MIVFMVKGGLVAVGVLAQVWEKTDLGDGCGSRSPCLSEFGSMLAVFAYQTSFFFADAARGSALSISKCNNTWTTRCLPPLWRIFSST